MAKQIDHTTDFITHKGQPLIGIIFRENGEEIVHYFAEDADVDAIVDKCSIEAVLNLAGCWRDLDWDVVEKELDRIRHESQPTPPLTLSVTTSPSRGRACI